MNAGAVEVGSFHLQEAIGVRVMWYGAGDAVAREYQGVLGR